MSWRKASSFPDALCVVPADPVYKLHAQLPLQYLVYIGDVPESGEHIYTTGILQYPMAFCQPLLGEVDVFFVGENVASLSVFLA